jgi:hypothetical protein
LHTTSGPGKDDVVLSVSAYPASGETAQLPLAADELGDGVERHFAGADSRSVHGMTRPNGAGRRYGVDGEPAAGGIDT